MQLAFELDFPPCVLLRRLLEELQLGLAKERITRALRQPDLLPSLVCPQALQRLAALLAADAEAVENAPGGVPGISSKRRAAAAAAGGREGAGSTAELQLVLLARLQRDLEECVLCDRVYSPASGEQQIEWGMHVYAHALPDLACGAFAS